jgi:hypothetical protein
LPLLLCPLLRGQLGQPSPVELDKEHQEVDVVGEVVRKLVHVAAALRMALRTREMNQSLA